MPTSILEEGGLYIVVSNESLAGKIMGAMQDYTFVGWDCKPVTWSGKDGSVIKTAFYPLFNDKDGNPVDYINGNQNLKDMLELAKFNADETDRVKFSYSVFQSVTIGDLIYAEYQSENVEWAAITLTII